MRTSAVLAILVSILALLPAIDPPRGYKPPRGYVAGRAEASPVIDGVLDDAIWAKAVWSEAFEDIEGDRQPKPRYRTRMKMAWDDKALYIAAELEEPDVWATIRTHDAVIFQDPDFEVFIDPDDDNHLYAELELNALNTTWDLLLTKPYKDGGRAINAWEILGLKSAVRVHGTLNDPRDRDTGWTVEIAWPWEGLKELGASAPPKEGDRWRINFSRVEWDTQVVDGKSVKIKGKPERNWVWSPQGVIDMHRPERWGFVEFTSQPVQSVAIPHDPLQGEWDRLHDFYYAQKSFQGRMKRYGSLQELGWTQGVLPTFEMTTSGWEASLERNGKRLTLRDDARKSIGKK